VTGGPPEKLVLGKAATAMRTGKIRWIAIASGAAVLAGGILFWSTPRGLGMNPDSVVYFTTARNIIEGRGFYVFDKPLLLHGAGYPALLSLVFRLGDDMTAARGLHAIVFGLNVLLIGIAAASFTRGSKGAVLIAILLFLASEHVWGIHALAWSEGPFVALLLSALLLHARALAASSRAALVPSAALLGLAIWTRFLGVTLLPPALLAVLLFGRRPARERVRDALLFGAIAVLPLAAWTVRNSIIAGSAAGRSLHAHPIGAAHLSALAGTAYEFFLPIDLWAPLEALQLGLLGALLVGAAAALRRARPGALRDPKTADVFHATTILFLPTYVGTLLVSISFLDALTHIDYRILAPLFPFAVLLAVSLVRNLAAETGRPFLWRSFFVASLFVVVVQADRAIAHVTTTRVFGRGYTNEAWRTSEGIELARSLESGVILYSNAPEAIRFLTGREARMLPRPVSVNTLEPNARFAEEVATIRSETESGEAVVLFFEEVRREQMPAVDEFARLSGLVPSRRLADAVVFGEAGARATGSQPAGAGASG